MSPDEQELENSSSLSVAFLPQGFHYNQTPETDQGPAQLVFFPHRESINQTCLRGRWSLKGGGVARRVLQTVQPECGA